MQKYSEIFIFGRIVAKKIQLVSVHVGDNFAQQDLFLLGDRLRDANTLLRSALHEEG